MTVFAAIKAAVLRTAGHNITEAYSSSDQVAVEMADLANEVAADIAKSHDWRDLTKIETFTGNGVQENFPKPADYDRMVLASSVDDADNWFWGYRAFRSVNEWLQFRNGGYGLVEPGAWIILGGEFRFYPAPAGNAVFPYVSRNWARSEAGQEKPQFTADDDEFVLDPRLLTLGLIWRWKAQKGLDYSEDMTNYELALRQAQARDKGSRIIRETRPSRTIGSLGLAYPHSLG